MSMASVLPSGSASARRARAAASPAALLYLRGRDADGRVRALVAERLALRPEIGALSLALVERRTHTKLGFRTLGDYARERLGVSSRSLRESARVFGALLELPRLRAAVVAGEVSWSAAGAAVAIVPPHLDALAAESLRGRTVRAVEEIVRCVRAAERPAELAGAADADSRVEVRLPIPRRVAERWRAAVELARRMAGENLPLWEAAEAIAAEASSALPPALLAEAWPGPPPLAARSRCPERAPAGAREHGLRHRAFPLLCWAPASSRAALHRSPEAVLALARNASPHALDRALRRAHARLQELDHDLGLLLLQILDRRLYAELGFASFERYAVERADLSPRTARRRVRLARLARPGGAAATAFRTGALTEAQALAVGGASDVSTERTWVAFARAHTLRGLEDALASHASGRAVIVFRAPPEAAIVFHAVVAAARAHLSRGPRARASTAEAVEFLLEHAIAAWEEQGRTFSDYADFARDGFRCTAPGCTARRNLQSHHVVFRSHGGPDEPWNRTTLCAFHHLRGIHARLVTCSGRAPGGLAWALGLRSEGPPLLRAVSGDRLIGGDTMRP